MISGIPIYHSLISEDEICVENLETLPVPTHLLHTH
jgi:hypothetical protein